MLEQDVDGGEVEAGDDQLAQNEDGPPLAGPLGPGQRPDEPGDQGSHHQGDQPEPASGLPPQIQSRSGAYAPKGRRHDRLRPVTARNTSARSASWLWRL